MKTILTLFCVFFLEYATFAQTSEITYEEVKLTNVGSISIPSIMELQSGVYKEFSDSFSKELGFDVSGVIVYQQAGLNDIFKTLKRSGTYARLMIDETPGKAGEYRRLDSKLVVTPRELRLLDTQFKNGIISQFQTSGAGLKLIRWDGVSVDKISGFDVLKTAYLRQLNDNPAVYVELYLVDNYDRQYLLTISYREEDSSIWKDALNKTKNSFKITNIRKPETRSMRDATKFDLSRVSKGTANTIPTDTTMAEPTPKPFPKIISGGVVNGKATNLVKPLYPAAARAVRARGAVNVQVVIDENGNVVSASAVSGHPLLRAAAVSAARLSKFSPTLLAGQPVKVAGVVVYNFQP